MLCAKFRMFLYSRTYTLMIGLNVLLRSGSPNWGQGRLGEGFVASRRRCHVDADIVYSLATMMYCSLDICLKVIIPRIEHYYLAFRLFKDSPQLSYYLWKVTVLGGTAFACR